MKRDTERSGVKQREEDFVEGLAAHYAPVPWTSAQRASFDEALRSRIAQPRRRGFVVPALASAAAVALVWFSFFSDPGVEESSPVAASAWENALFLSSDVSPLDDRVESEALPDDYLAIASLFLDG